MGQLSFLDKRRKGRTGPCCGKMVPGDLFPRPVPRSRMIKPRLSSSPNGRLRKQGTRRNWKGRPPGRTTIEKNMCRKQVRRARKVIRSFKGTNQKHPSKLEKTRSRVNEEKRRPPSGQKAELLPKQSNLFPRMQGWRKGGRGVIDFETVNKSARKYNFRERWGKF